MVNYKIINFLNQITIEKNTPFRKENKQRKTSTEEDFMAININSTEQQPHHKKKCPCAQQQQQEKVSTERAFHVCAAVLRTLFTAFTMGAGGLVYAAGCAVTADEICDKLCMSHNASESGCSRTPQSAPGRFMLRRPAFMSVEFLAFLLVLYILRQEKPLQKRCDDQTGRYVDSAYEFIQLGEKETQKKGFIFFYSLFTSSSPRYH